MRSMKHLLLSVMAALFMVVASSCEHRLLQDPNNTHYIRVYLDEQIKNVTCGFYNESYDRPSYSTPVIMRAVLSSPSSGKVMSESLLRRRGSDERGDYIDGYIAASGGEYNLMIYQMGSPATLFRNPNNFYEILAYTKDVNDQVMGYLPTLSKDEEKRRIVYEPDHVLAAVCERIPVRTSSSVDTLRNHEGDYFTAGSIAKSYYLQLRIKGAEWVSTAAAVLSGVSGSKLMCTPDEVVATDPVSVFFGMKYTGMNRRGAEQLTTAVMYTTFATFGKIENMSSVLAIDFEFTKSDGSTQVEKIDITEEFKTQMAIENQWILIDKEILIYPPSGTGGMEPSVEGWKDIEGSVVM